VIAQTNTATGAGMPPAPVISEAQWIAADLHYNELKNSGELERRKLERAVRSQTTAISKNAGVMQ
jgi:hypothetical protein